MKTTKRAKENRYQVPRVSYVPGYKSDSMLGLTRVVITDDICCLTGDRAERIQKKWRWCAPRQQASLFVRMRHSSSRILGMMRSRLYRRMIPGYDCRQNSPSQDTSARKLRLKYPQVVYHALDHLLLFSHQLLYHTTCCLPAVLLLLACCRSQTFV